MQGDIPQDKTPMILFCIKIYKINKTQQLHYKIIPFYIVSLHVNEG